MTLEKKSIFSLTTLLLMTSCSTYYLTTDSLKKQFNGIDSTNLRPVVVRGPIAKQYKYLANPIDTIECVDSKGNLVKLINKPSIEMRVTEKNGKRTIFYFDRIFLTDSTLVGVRSRFISSIRASIKLREIKKIEVQDGKKNFNYVEK